MAELHIVDLKQKLTPSLDGKLGYTYKELWVFYFASSETSNANYISTATNHRA